MFVCLCISIPILEQNAVSINVILQEQPALEHECSVTYTMQLPDPLIRIVAVGIHTARRAICAFNKSGVSSIFGQFLPKPCFITMTFFPKHGNTRYFKMANHCIL